MKPAVLKVQPVGPCRSPGHSTGIHELKWLLKWYPDLIYPFHSINNFYWWCKYKMGKSAGALVLIKALAPQCPSNCHVFTSKLLEVWKNYRFTQKILSETARWWILRNLNVFSIHLKNILCCSPFNMLCAWWLLWGEALGWWLFELWTKINHCFYKI